MVVGSISTPRHSRCAKDSPRHRAKLHLDAPKTRTVWRRLDLDAETVDVLRAHRRAQFAEMQLVGVGYRDEGYVFARPDGKPWRPDSIGQAYRRIVSRLGLPAIALHDLRHTHASLLLATATEPNVVADRLGHASAGFTPVDVRALDAGTAGRRRLDASRRSSIGRS